MQRHRRVLFIGFVVAILSICLPAVSSATAPIPIGSIEELQRIGNDDAYPINGYYILTRDIDASRTASWNGGAGFMPIGQRREDDDSLAFGGWFDGQGFVIRGLVINRPDEEGVGLFGSIGRNAVVVNVGLEGGSVTGGNYVGALVGENWSHEVAACHASAAIAGGSRIGGLAGINRGTIDMCVAAGDVTGVEFVGGLVGRNYAGVVQDSISTSRVSGRLLAGGLVGETVDGAVYDSYWDITLSGIAVSGGGQGLTTAEMMRYGLL